MTRKLRLTLAIARFSRVTTELQVGEVAGWCVVASIDGFTALQFSERSHRPSRWRWARCRSATSALELGDVFYGAGMLWSCLANRVLIFLALPQRACHARREHQNGPDEKYERTYIFFDDFLDQGRWGRELQVLIISTGSVGVICNVLTPYYKETPSRDIL